MELRDAGLNQEREKGGRSGCPTLAHGVESHAGKKRFLSSVGVATAPALHAGDLGFEPQIEQFCEEEEGDASFGFRCLRRSLVAFLSNLSVSGISKRECEGILELEMIP